MGEIPRSEQQEEEPKIGIEEFLEKHEEQVIGLINDIYENELGWHSKSGRPDLEVIPKMYQKNDGNFWVACENERVVGTIGLLDEGEKRATLHRFCVQKEFRGQDKKVSSSLFSTLLEFAEKRKLQKIFLATHDQAVPAMKFYDKAGFKRIKFESLPDDIAGRSYMGKDDIIYELDLDVEEKTK